MTILPTYKCTAACKNCCFGSHPWVDGRIPQREILRYIDEAAKFPSMRIICFSGGECFLLGDDLVESIAHATRLGLATRCVTNGYWAPNMNKAMSTCRKLLEAGLTELNFSTGDNHTEYVPIENIIYGAAAARRMGFGLAIMVESTAERKVTRETLLAHPLYVEYFADDQEMERTICESPWVPMDSAHPAVTYSADLLINQSNVAGRDGCRSILRTIVATPQRNFKICCGITSEQIPELTLGSLDHRAMQEMYDDALQDFMKIWIAVDGPERILAWAASRDATIEWQDRFAHKCHACQFMYQDPKVKNVIREHYQDVATDVLMRFALGAVPE